MQRTEMEPQHQETWYNVTREVKGSYRSNYNRSSAKHPQESMNGTCTRMDRSSRVWEDGR